MSDQVLSSASDAVEEVRYVLKTTLRAFSSDWERYEDDFEDLGADHLGRQGKYSVKAIIGQHDSRSFANELREALEDFIHQNALPKFNTPDNPEKFLLLVKTFFSYLRKTTEWFDAIFSDLDDVTWPLDEGYSCRFVIRSIINQSFYNAMRMKIRDNYLKQCTELRRRYSYECTDVFQCFYNKLIVPLFESMEQWELADERTFWWQPFHDEFEKIVRDKMTKVNCDEQTFVTLASCCMQAEILMFKYLPDTRDQSNFKIIKGKLDNLICKLYWERRDYSFIGLLSKNNFDKFHFGQLLKMLAISPRHEDMLLMRLRSKIRFHFELRALELVPVVPNRPLTLEELEPLLTELEETKAFLQKRLAERLEKFPCLDSIRIDILCNSREQLEIYAIDDRLALTEGKLISRLQEKVEVDSAFQKEAKLIALYIKHLAWGAEFMNELETFAETKIAANQHEMVSTLAKFVSMHKSVCSNGLCTILSDANLIDEE